MTSSRDSVPSPPHALILFYRMPLDLSPSTTGLPGVGQSTIFSPTVPTVISSVYRRYYRCSTENNNNNQLKSFKIILRLKTPNAAVNNYYYYQKSFVLLQNSIRLFELEDESSGSSGMKVVVRVQSRKQELDEI